MPSQDSSLRNKKIRLAISHAAMNKSIIGDLGKGWQNVEWTMDQIRAHIYAGRPICVAHLKSDHRTGENFAGANIIGIDFDKGPNIERLCAEDEWVNKYAFLVYSTPNHTDEKPRSRALFLLEEEVTDPEVYRKLVAAMLYKYGEQGADQQCKDVVRLFFGSRDASTSINPSSLSLDLIMSLPLPIPREEDFVDEEFSIDLSVARSGISDILGMGSQPGSRDNDALRLVGALSNTLSPDVVKEIMRLWYHNRVSDKTDFGWDKVESMVERMSKKAAPIRKQVLDTVETVTKPAPKPTVAAPYSMGFGSFVSMEDQAAEWLIEGWLPQATTGMIVAPPASYKTWIMMAMALAVGTGKPFLGKYAVRRPSPVLIIQQEDNKSTIRQRLKTIYESMVSEVNDTSEGDTISLDLVIPDVDIYTWSETLRFDNENAMKQLREMIAKRGYKLVFVDPLYSAADSEGYMAKDAQRMVAFKRMRDDFGTSFMMLHHTKKSAEGINRLDAWGSQFLNAWLETGYQLRRTSDPNSVRIQRHFKESGNPETEILTFDINTDPAERRFTVSVSLDMPDEVMTVDTAQDQGIDLLQVLGQRLLTQADLAKESGLSSSTVSRRMNKLEAKGLVIKEADGRYRTNNPSQF